MRLGAKMVFKEISKNRAKHIRVLARSRKRRISLKRFVVEGLLGCKEAVRAGFTVDFAVLSEDFILGHGEELKSEIFSRIPLFSASERDFNSFSNTVSPQGILAVVKIREHMLEDMLTDNPLLVALDRVSDPGNLGTIIRTSDAAGAKGVILGNGCVDAYNPKVIRATMGSIFHIPVSYGQDLVEVLTWLKSRGVQIVCTHINGSRYYWDVDFKLPTVIVMGNEDEGVSEDIAKLCDVSAIIEMPGSAESLNVSVAQGIILFEAIKQRG